ncbi:MAG: hypothetical protein AAFN70_21735, partial [Planctomycetota bacterium]
MDSIKNTVYFGNSDADGTLRGTAQIRCPNEQTPLKRKPPHRPTRRRLVLIFTRAPFACMIWIGCAVMGCAVRNPTRSVELTRMLSEVRVSDPAPETTSRTVAVVSSPSPFSVRNATSDDWVAPEPWDLTIEEAVQIALANSTVLRN